MIDSYKYNASYTDEEALQKAISLSRTQYNNEIVYDTVSRKAPSHLCCPFTKHLFRDPVQVIHGNTYEREAILEWFSISQTEPFSVEKLFITVLFENESILAECNKYLRRHSRKNLQLWKAKTH